jgi:hypothetical protein
MYIEATFTKMAEGKQVKGKSKQYQDLTDGTAADLYSSKREGDLCRIPAACWVLAAAWCWWAVASVLDWGGRAETRDLAARSPGGPGGRGRKMAGSGSSGVAGRVGGGRWCCRSEPAAGAGLPSSSPSCRPLLLPA